MLIRFRVGNFLSFNGIEEFSMIGGPVRNKSEHLKQTKDLKLRRFTAIFGANASGKSNIVTAMDFTRNLIVEQTKISSSQKYCRINDANKHKPSYLEFEISIDQEYYAYGFEIQLEEGVLVSEWLVELLPNDTEKIIFERDLKKGTLTFGSQIKDVATLNILNVFGNEIKTNNKILFLTEMNRNKDEFFKTSTEATILKDTYDWFKKTLNINYPDMPISPYSYFMSEVKSEAVKNLLSSFGTGISDYSIKEIDLGYVLNSGVPKELINKIVDDLQNTKNNQGNKNHPTSLLRGNKKVFFFELQGKVVHYKTLEFIHKNCASPFSIDEESDGTRRLLDLIEVLFSARGNRNKTFIIDEVDRSLHPQLTYRFIEQFLKESTNTTVQLIVTTHESRLMDFNLLRRDEIWLVDKNLNGESSLYSLDAFNTRFDQKIDKAYLDGRYGGIPLFSTLFPIEGCSDADSN